MKISLFLFSLLLVPAIGRAAATTDYYSESGNTSAVSFSRSLDSCTYLYGNITVAEFMVRHSGNDDNFIDSGMTYSLIRHNYCTGMDESYIHGFAQADSVTFNRANTILQTVISGYDEVNHITVPVQVSLTWSAAGKFVKSPATVYRYEFGDFKLVSQTSGSSAPAAVSGSISDGVNEYLGTSYTAYIGTLKTGEILITK